MGPSVFSFSWWGCCWVPTSSWQLVLQFGYDWIVPQTPFCLHISLSSSWGKRYPNFGNNIEHFIHGFVNKKNLLVCCTGTGHSCNAGFWRHWCCLQMLVHNIRASFMSKLKLKGVKAQDQSFWKFNCKFRLWIRNSIFNLAFKSLLKRHCWWGESI
jgi:hypothetical protein